MKRNDIYITELMFSFSDGKILATAAGQLKTFNCSDNKKIQKFPGHPVCYILATWIILSFIPCPLFSFLLSFHPHYMPCLSF